MFLSARWVIHRDIWLSGCGFKLTFPGHYYCILGHAFLLLQPYNRFLLWRSCAEFVIDSLDSSLLYKLSVLIDRNSRFFITIFTIKFYCNFKFFSKVPLLIDQILCAFSVFGSYSFYMWSNEKWQMTNDNCIFAFLCSDF